MSTRSQAFERLCEIMGRLRGPGGCPWDLEQTHDSLVKYLIEECYEVAEAVERGDDEELKKELGDVLLQVVFHAEIARSEERFDIAEVIDSISEKMVYRHPHVFGETEVEDANEVLRQWEALKQKEKGDSEDNSILEGVPNSLPALMRAQRYQSRASQVGFDWENSGQVLDKVREELDELENARETEGAQRVEEEFGDLLFALVNWARFNEIDAEKALHNCNRKFSDRFQHIEKSLTRQGTSVHDAGVTEMDALWEEAKVKEGGR